LTLAIFVVWVYNVVMSNDSDGEFTSGNSDLLERHYEKDGARKVTDRFRLYDLAANPCNFELKTVDTLTSLTAIGDNTILDLGTSDAHFLQLLHLCDHRGRLIGVEPNTEQYNQGPLWQPLDPDPIFEAIKKSSGLEASEEYLRELASTVSHSVPDGIELFEGNANYIPLPSDSVDVLTAMFMFYHVPEDKQEQAYAEIKRVIKPDGLFILTTSGKDNKKQHRVLEKAIAERLGITEPALMNSGFTTEKAEVELPKHFRYIYRFLHNDKIQITDNYGVRCYLRSQQSLMDQYDPVPDKETFDDVLAKIVFDVIMKAIAQKKVFTDPIRQSMFLCSDVPLIGVPPEFEPISEKAA